jgi:hypothetical protein
MALFASDREAVDRNRPGKAEDSEPGVSECRSHSDHQ